MSKFKFVSVLMEKFKFVSGLVVGMVLGAVGVVLYFMYLVTYRPPT